MRGARAWVLAAVIVVTPSVALASEPIAALSYTEALAFTNGGEGANRLRGVGADLLFRSDDPWVLYGVALLCRPEEADQAAMRAGILRWGLGVGESPDSDDGIDLLLGFAEVTFQLFHVGFEEETRNGLGAGVALGIHGFLPPQGAIYYRVGARAAGGHLVTTDDAFGLLSLDFALGIRLRLPPEVPQTEPVD